jgi:hypothetical protein
MPITAEIEDLAPAEFLLLLSLTSKTGKLSAVHRGRKILLAVRDGSIVYAARPAVRERLGSTLINRGLITEEDLIEALAEQRRCGEGKLLGTILVESGALSHDALCEVIQGQFEVVVRDLLSWNTGVMVFETSDMPDLGGIHVDPSEILVGLGVRMDTLLVESLAGLQTEDGESPDPRVGSPEVGRPTQDEIASSQARKERSALSSLVEEADSQSVSLTAEMTLAMLGAASEVAERALLLLVYPNYLSGAGGFGQGRDGVQLTGQQLQIDRSQGSAFSRVIDRRNSYRGPLDDVEGHRQLVEALGGVPEGGVIVVPLTVGGQVVAVLYADGGADVGTMEGLKLVEATVAEVSALLEAESRSFAEAAASA